MRDLASHVRQFSWAMSCSSHFLASFERDVIMNKEKVLHVASGWGMLAVVLLMFAGSIACFVLSLISMIQADESALPVPVLAVLGLIVSVLIFVVAIIVSNGFFSLQPGQARICVLFGQYQGTVRDEGLRWANPFFSKNLGTVLGKSSSSLKVGEEGVSFDTSKPTSATISLRARTHDGERIKVNDKMGNPIEIATVVVWHVADTAKAAFDVDNYESYVSMQTETALRHVASIYAYDHMEDEDNNNNAITLRSNIEEVSATLKAELDCKLSVAGVSVDDARLTHLAYAPEIAQAMLRRQQADAVIAARKKIVEGAVSMVDMALSQLSDGGIVEFDEDRKAVMASNLMVVLCGESEAQPVVNTGSLYQ